MAKQIEITLRKGWIGTTENQKANLRGLGLRHRHQTVLRQDDAATRGMIMKVVHMLDVRPAGKAQTQARRGVNVEITPGKAPAPKKSKKTTASKSKTKKTVKEKE